MVLSPLTVSTLETMVSFFETLIWKQFLGLEDSAGLLPSSALSGALIDINCVRDSVGGGGSDAAGM